MLTVRSAMRMAWSLHAAIAAVVRRQVDYAIPSRMREGYGINKRIVEEFQLVGVQLIAVDCRQSGIQ